MNKLIVSGNLTADPVLNEREYVDKVTGEIIKTKVCNFSVAVDDGYKDRKTTQFFRVNAWRDLGEICAKYLKKGRQIIIEGSVKLNNYVDKSNNLHAAMEIRADGVEFLQDGKNIKVTTPPPEGDFEDTPY